MIWEKLFREKKESWGFQEFGGCTDSMVDYNNVVIKPDIECHTTLRDFKNNYDRVMAEG